MGLWSKLFSRGSAPSPAPVLPEPLEADPLVGPVLGAARRGEPGPAAALFAQSSGAWELRTQLALAVAEVAAARPAETGEVELDGLVGGGDAFWRLVRGRFHYIAGWEARGSGRGADVGEEAAELLEARCQLARADLEAASAALPGDPTPFALLIPVARGLGDPDLAEAAWSEASRRDPDAWTAAGEMLRSVSPRWFGSMDELWAFARQTAGQHPGRDLAALPLMAHLDQYQYQVSFLEEPDQALADLRVAVPSLVACCQASVDAPGYVPTRATLTIRHTAAALFWRADEKQRCREQLQRAGPVLVKAPWGTQAAQTFAAVQAELGLQWPGGAAREAPRS